MTYSTFDNLTVRQYQEIVGIQTDKEMSEEDKIIQSICVLTGLTEREVEEMTIVEFNKVGRELANIFSEKPTETKPPRNIRAGGKLYGITYNPRNLAYYQYADIQAWISQNAITNMHKVVASLAFPVKRFLFFRFKGKNDPSKHPEIAEALLDCKYSDVHAICVFFSLLWNNSIKALADSLTKDKRETMTEEQKVQMRELLQIVSDGYITPSK